MTFAFNSMELMICCAARLLEDGCTVAAGTGVPCARRCRAETHAPNLVIFFEAGGVRAAAPDHADQRGATRGRSTGLMATSMADVMETCQRGMMDYTFLGGAQIDAFGNLNSTIIGKDYAHPKVRLPGSGGANDLASLCWRILVVTNHDSRRFVPKLDFMTTPGFLTGPGAREAAGLPPGTGPYRVITDLAILGFHEQTKRMEIVSLHPEYSPGAGSTATGFEAPGSVNRSPPHCRRRNRSLPCFARK